VIVLRKRLGTDRGQLRLFEEYRYFFYITNDRTIPAEGKIGARPTPRSGPAPGRPGYESFPPRPRLRSELARHASRIALINPILMMFLEHKFFHFCPKIF
jgi:hypothetical protein